MRGTIAIACFFFSGLAGLIYEVCWIRRAALVFGSTSFALSTVLALFFLGLALGSYTFGRLSRRIAQPLRTYAALEIALAALALISLPAFGLAERLHVHAYRALGGEAVMLWPVRIALVALVLLPPTFLMGGTLPLFCQQFTRNSSRIASSVGLLYGINTLGAALGCALAGFVLIPGLGMERAVMVGAVLNLVSGIVVAALRLPMVSASSPGVISPRARTPEPAPVSTPSPALVSRGTTVVLLLAFLTGFAALGQEVLWARFLALLVRNTVYTYTLTLTVVLVGIVIGSLVASTLFDRRLPRAGLFGVIQILSGVAVLALAMLPAAMWEQLGEGLALYALLLLPAAILSGISFPLAVRLVVDDPALAGIGVGRVAALNTLGGIVGSLAIGFVALPRLGLEGSTLLTTGISVSAGLAAVLALEQRGSFVARSVVAGLGVVLWLAIPRLTKTRLPADYLANGGELVAFREGLESDLAIVRREGVPNLEINRLWQGQGRKTHQIMAAHLPMLLHPQARRVLVVGVGAGQTPGRFLMYDLERLDCVDIEPAIFDFIRPHFRTAWMNDPRVGLIRADGRNFLTSSNTRYDVISLEIGQVFRPGVANFYTAEFYRRARARLTPEGLLSQFVPLRMLSPEAFRSVVSTFIEVFPRSALFYNTSELLLLGVNGERLELTSRHLAVLAVNAPVHHDLRFSHWDGPAYFLNQPRVLLGMFLSGPPGLAALAAGAPVYHDDRPVLEYETARVSDAVASEIANLELLRRHLDPIETMLPAGPASDSLSVAARTVRERNLGDIVTQTCLRSVVAARAQGGHETVVALLSRGLEANPDNAEANRVLGDALLNLGRPAEAEARFRKAATMRPSDALARRGMGFALHRQGRIAEAIPEYRAALELGNDDPEIHNNLGAALGAEGDLGAALPHFERAVKLRPGFGEARENLERTREALAASRRR
jgi:spermidine synthase